MNKKLHFSSGKDDWQTPFDLFNAFNARFQFVLDAAANSDNHLVDRWFGPGGECEDALGAEWPLFEGNIWLNPPYSRGVQKKFIAKALYELRAHPESGHCVIALLPARTDTALFHNFLYDAAAQAPRSYVRSMQFLKGRLKFGGAAHGAPFPSMIVALQ